MRPLENGKRGKSVVWSFSVSVQEGQDARLPV